MVIFQPSNISSTILLCHHGYNGQVVFEATIKKKQEQRAVTGQHSQERIDLNGPNPEGIMGSMQEAI
eukprot:scaffold2634_cov108-Skeletonema_menzelii.AAC.4